VHPVDNAAVVQWIVSGLMALVACFGGFVIRNLGESIKDQRVANEKLADELRNADQALRHELSTMVLKDDFKEWRAEQRTLFQQLFQRMDDLRDQVATKADRT
jgi:hypothetical protein